MGAATAALAALAQETRLEAFRLLARHGPEGLAAGEAARRLGVPQNTLSAHLSVLARARLVRAERRGRSVIYRAEPEGLRDLVVFLLRDCREGRAAASGPVPAGPGKAGC